MRARLFLLFLFSVLFSAAKAQNLVVNGGFESATSPAISTWPHENPPGTDVVNGWYTPTRATPDYYNSDRSVCDGFPIALARTGEGRAAVICGMRPQLPGVYNYKEYLQGSLTEPLQAGKKYNVRFFVTLDCSSQFTSTGLGAYFSTEPVRRDNKERINVKPQVISYQKITYADGWTEISGSFIANGGERYLMIGSYSDTSVIELSSLGQHPMTFFASPHIRQNVYMYVDDVCVSPAESDVCGCKKKEEPKIKSEAHYFLFLLDVSNSMGESGKLKLLKKQMKRFADSLGTGNQVGIMTFSDHTQMLLPFTDAGNKENLSKTLDKMDASGSTNGELALRRLVKMLDSLKLPGHCHVILATDGIFEISKRQKTETDSCFVRNQATLCVLQFGDNKNADLEELSHSIPSSTYHFVSKKNIDAVIDEQLPEDAPPPPPVPHDHEVVYYTSVENLTGMEYVRLFLQSNPDDEFDKIPRK